MKSEMLMNEIKKEKVIVIVRGVPDDKIVRTAQALYDGGIRLMEITYDHKNAAYIEKTVNAIKAVREQNPDMYVGAGTVLTVEEVEAAKEAGGSFVISPDVNEAVIKKAKELDMVSMPGALTPTEIVRAYEAGASIVKVFPVSNLGCSYVKAVRAPLGHIPMAAVGGINLDNMEEYYKAGMCAFGIGGNIVDQKLIDAEDYDALKKKAQKYMMLAKSF